MVRYVRRRRFYNAVIQVRDKIRKAVKLIKRVYRRRYRHKHIMIEIGKRIEKKKREAEERRRKEEEERKRREEAERKR